MLSVPHVHVQVYTHGEMLPAHGYPKLRDHPNLKGHWGGAWQLQVLPADKLVLYIDSTPRPFKFYVPRIHMHALVLDGRINALHTFVHSYIWLAARVAHPSPYVSVMARFQKFDFHKFPGPIVVTTNCLIEPRGSYRGRLFTKNEVGVRCNISESSNWHGLAVWHMSARMQLAHVGGHVPGTRLRTHLNPECLNFRHI